MKSLSMIAVVVGVLCLAASLLWAMLFPASSSWTQEKSDRMSELRLKGHSLGGELDNAQRRPSMHGRKVADIEAEYKKVSEEMTLLREEFEGKRDSPKTMASILRWSGAAFVIAGGLATMAGRNG